MDSEDIYIERVLSKKPATHKWYSEKGFEAVLTADIVYYGVSIRCNLVKGRCKKDATKIFYFFEMPCMLFRQKNRSKWLKINHLNFRDSNLLRNFQDKAFASLFSLEDNALVQSIKSAYQ